MADRFDWPQHWVDQSDPEYIDGLKTFLMAQDDHNLFESEMKPEERERKARQRAITRKAELAKRLETERKRNENT